MHWLDCLLETPAWRCSQVDIVPREERGEEAGPKPSQPTGSMPVPPSGASCNILTSCNISRSAPVSGQTACLVLGQLCSPGRALVPVHGVSALDT